MKKIESMLSKPRLILIILVAMAIPALMPLFKPGFFPTQDFIHVARIYEMDQALKDGQFPVRWVADFRYGEPLFNFYAPLPFYMGALIHNINFNFLDTTKILFGLSFVLSGITMYFLARCLFGIWGGLISAALYIYAPYHSVDIYVRGALAESWALIFFPLIFLGAWKLSQRQTINNLIFLAASLAGLFFTHNIMTILFSPFFLGWLIFLTWTNFSKKLILYYLAATILGFSLAATFLLPGFLEKGYVQTDKLITGYFDYRGHFVEIRQFFSTFWGYGASLWGSEDGMSFQIGLVHLAILVLSLLSTFFLRKNKKIVFMILFLTLELLFSLFMQHNKSTPIWVNLSILSYTQFPWRFLGISIFLISIIGGSLSLVLKGKWFPVSLGIIIIIIAYNLQYFKPENYYADSIDDHYISSKVLLQDDKLPKDYLPIWVKSIALEKLLSPHTVEGEARVIDFQKNSQGAQFNIQVIKPADIEVPLTYFPGWKAWANNQPVSLETPDKFGLIRLKLPEGEYAVKLKFTNTLIRQIGNGISFLAFLIIITLLIKNHSVKNHGKD